MSNTLVPCPSCERHVRVTEPACPFCTAALPSTLARRAVPATTQRLTRAATFVFGATLVAAGCGTPVTPGDTGGNDAVVDMGGPMPLYGGPTPDAGPDGSGPGPDASRPDAWGPDGNSGPDASGPDGSTPQDAAEDVTPRDMGGPMPLYGGPTPVDAGENRDVRPPRDGGGVVPLYGLPPPDGF